MTKSNLLILGNGFDLSCKLRSSYSNYFNSKFNKKNSQSLDSLKKVFESFYKRSVERKKDTFSVYAHGKNEETPYEKVEGINIWDLIIYYGKEGLPDKWSDVESRILEFLNYDPENVNKKLNIPNRTQMQDYDYTIGKIYVEESDYSTYSSYFYSQLIIFAAAKFGLPNPSTSDKVLLSELKRFEGDFTDYMKSLLNQEGIYHFHRNADHLLSAIETQTDSTGLINQNILSFNYTSPFTEDEISNKLIKWQNIHGRLGEENIIFGVDQDKVKVTDTAYQFTKTYRQLLQNNNEQNDSKTILPIKTDIEKIIFYGHSLSEADYSYFQSIFDYYELYGSQVELIFLYCEYKLDEKNLIQQEQVFNVSKLIKKYGQTMGNKDHGDNLLHKLIIEKRLTIKKLNLPPMI